MKRNALLFLLLIFLSGCATYKFHHGKEPYNKGYVVSRDDYTILEYTVGKDKTVPRLAKAQERFKRRRKIVEDYYKRMGYIENRFKMAFMDPAIYFLKLVGGVFRLPGIAISDYRARHNPKYKERIRKIEEEKDAREETRIKNFKDKLDAYIQKDLASEAVSVPVEVAPEVGKLAVQEEESKETVQPEPVKVTEEPMPETKTEVPALIEQQLPQVKETPPATEVIQKPQPQKLGFFKRLVDKFKFKRTPKAARPKVTKIKVAKPKKEKPKAPAAQPQAIIIAKPAKGYSPLRVKFCGSKSYVPKGKIIAYSWDFGDGDTSTKPNPTNTYYSATFQPQYFTVILNVQDDRGNTAQATTTIEVLNK